MARLPRGPGGPGGAGKPVPSAGSWQRHTRQARFTLLSSVAGEAGGTNQPRSREAWKQKRPSQSQNNTKSHDRITGSLPSVPGRTTSRPPLNAGCSARRAPAATHRRSWARAPCEVPARRRGSLCPLSDLCGPSAQRPQQARQRTLHACSERRGAETPRTAPERVGTGPEPAEKESGRGGGPGEQHDAVAVGGVSAGGELGPRVLWGQDRRGLRQPRGVWTKRSGPSGPGGRRGSDCCSGEWTASLREGPQQEGGQGGDPEELAQARAEWSREELPGRTTGPGPQP